MQVIFEPCDIWRVVFVWIVQSGGCTVQNKKVGNKPDTTIRGGEVIIFEPVLSEEEEQKAPMIFFAPKFAVNDLRKGETTAIV